MCRHNLAVDAWHKVVHAVHQRVRLQAGIEAEERLNSVTAGARRKQLQGMVSRDVEAASELQSKAQCLDIVQKQQDAVVGKELEEEELTGLGDLQRNGRTRPKMSLSSHAKKRKGPHSLSKRDAGENVVEEESLRRTLRRLVRAQGHPQDAETL